MDLAEAEPVKLRFSGCVFRLIAAAIPLAPAPLGFGRKKDAD